MICPHCQQENPPDAPACTHCLGSLLPAQRVPLTRHERLMRWGISLTILGVFGGLLVIGGTHSATISDPPLLTGLRGAWNERGWIMLAYDIMRTLLLACLPSGIICIVIGQWSAKVSILRMACYFIVFSLFAAVVYPLLFTRAREGSSRSCMNNQRQLVIRALVYANDNDEIMPGDWPDFSLSTNPEIYYCPGSYYSRYRPWGGYGYNSRLAGLALGDILNPAVVIVIADSVQPMMLMKSPEDIDKRHKSGFIAAFMDGHVDWLKANEKVKWR